MEMLQRNWSLITNKLQLKGFNTCPCYTTSPIEQIVNLRLGKPLNKAYNDYFSVFTASSLIQTALINILQNRIASSLPYWLSRSCEQRLIIACRKEYLCDRVSTEILWKLHMSSNVVIVISRKQHFHFNRNFNCCFDCRYGFFSNLFEKLNFPPKEK